MVVSYPVLADFAGCAICQAPRTQGINPGPVVTRRTDRDDPFCDGTEVVENWDLSTAFWIIAEIFFTHPSSLPSPRMAGDSQDGRAINSCPDPESLGRICESQNLACDLNPHLIGGGENRFLDGHLGRQGVIVLVEGLPPPIPRVIKIYNPFFVDQ